MRILIVGAGALGGLFGAKLTEAGQDVTLLESNVARASLLAEEGLYVAEGAKGESRVRMKVQASVEGMDPVDLLFVAVKSYQTGEAIESVVPAINDDTWVLSTQNGVGNVEQIERFVPPERILIGITSHSAQHTGPNRIRHGVGTGPIRMAPVTGQGSSKVERILEVLNAAGLKAEIADDIDHAVWQRLLHIAVISPVSALTGMACSELLEDEDLQHLMRRLCDEIVEVMRARGVPIENEDAPYAPLIETQQALGKNRSSMWQDLVRGFRTEIDAINGGVVAEAERLGLEAPLNWAIVRLMHSSEGAVSRRQARASRVVGAVTKEQLEMPVRGVARGSFGGMPSGRVPLLCAPRLKQLVRDYYRDVDAASRDPQRRVAWCSGLGPVELVRALGYVPYFPENHAAMVGASRMSGKYIAAALADGFSAFASSEMVSDVGAMLAGESPLVKIHDLEGIPHPDVLVYSTNFGRHLARWFEYYNHRLDVPVFGLHPPFFLDEIEQIDEEAACQQMLRLIGRLEQSSGAELDQDRLSEIVLLSAKASSLWMRILDLARQVPSPLTFFDTLIHVGPMILMRGTEAAVTYYEILLAELEQRLASEVAAIQGEKYRFYWEGPPIWSALRPMARLFMDQRIAVVGSTYARVFALEGLAADDPIGSMARTYMSIYPNRSREYKARYLAREFRAFGVDAAVYHEGRTSADLSTARYGLHIRLERDTGVTPLVIESDSHDPRLVSLDQIQGQVIEYVEQVEGVVTRRQTGTV